MVESQLRENKKQQMMIKNKREKKKSTNCKSLNEIWTKLTELHPTSFCALCTVFRSVDGTFLYVFVRCRWFVCCCSFYSPHHSESCFCCGGGLVIVLFWCVVLLGWTRPDFAWMVTAQCVCVCMCSVLIWLGIKCARTYLNTSTRLQFNSHSTVRYGAVHCFTYLNKIFLLFSFTTTRNTLFQLFYFAVCVHAHAHTSIVRSFYMWMILILLGFANLTARVLSVFLFVLSLLVFLHIYYLFQVICVFVFVCRAPSFYINSHFQSSVDDITIFFFVSSNTKCASVDLLIFLSC